MKDAASFLHCSTVHFVTVGATVGKTRPDLARLSALTFPAMPMWPGIHARIIWPCHFVAEEYFLARRPSIPLMFVVLNSSIDWSVERESEKTTVGVGSVSYSMSRLLSTASSSASSTSVPSGSRATVTLVSEHTAYAAVPAATAPSVNT